MLGLPWATTVTTTLEPTCQNPTLTVGGTAIALHALDIPRYENRFSLLKAETLRSLSLSLSLSVPTTAGDRGIEPNTL